MHIVHTKQGLAEGESPLEVDAGLAVTGFFFQVTVSLIVNLIVNKKCFINEDEDNAALTPLIDSLKDIKESKSEVAVVDNAFKNSDLIKVVAPVDGSATTTYATYPGSLTTPPCDEVVHWIVFLTPLKISQAQLDAFRMLRDSHDERIVDNFRPVQPLNGRTVQIFG